jgi:hypothetical protein
MKLSKRIWVEQAIKYVIIFSVTAYVWIPIKSGLLAASGSGKLEAIAVVMGIVSLCALTGYFAFSYMTVGKKPFVRWAGFVCAAFLTIPLILTWLILYFIASIWIPEMSLVWGFVLLTLYIGTFIFDNLDLLRLGKDVAATSFFEQGIYNQTDTVSSAVTFLKEGQRLEFANTLIGRAVLELGKTKNNSRLKKAGEWIIDNSKKSQHEIDVKVAETFSKYGENDNRIRDIISELQQKQKQSTADVLIASLLELVKGK